MMDLAPSLPSLPTPTPTSVSGQELALQRTSMANTRTLLAYVRTALGFGGFSLALAKLFDGYTLCFAPSSQSAYFFLVLGTFGCPTMR